jgi:hypothetical protein
MKYFALDVQIVGVRVICFGLSEENICRRIIEICPQILIILIFYIIVDNKDVLV